MLCQSNAHQILFVQAVIDDGGEGVILRRLYSLYENGRSTSLVKLKVFKLKEMVKNNRILTIFVGLSGRQGGDSGGKKPKISFTWAVCIGAGLLRDCR